MTRKRTLLTGALAVAAGAMLSACVVAPPYYAAGYEGGYYDGAVAVAPPAPQYEVVGVAPAPGYFWIGGYWGWRGGRHVWVDGRWERSRPGYRYEPHGWQRGPQGWRESPGRWRPMN
ncbi:MAG TPA: hypothetical protein VGQ91_06215 [Ideonella sp.]|nr:hypothetical protein [Ideonella sp.]